MIWMRLILGMIAAGVIAWGVSRIRPRRVDYPTAESLILPSVDPLVRDVALAGAVNFRDIGGYRTASGHCVRLGRVYRAAALNNLTPDDLDRLAALDLKLMCDLRSREETREHPDRLPAGARGLHLPVGAEGASVRRLRAMLFDRRQMAGLVLLSYTETMIDGHAHVIGAALRSMADEANLPMVVHCTAGKDRTGVVIALLLALLGVPDETILSDYSQSNRHYAVFRRYGEMMVARYRVLGLNADDLFPLLVADAAVLRATLGYVRQKYGSVEVYLREKAGVDDALQARLKDLLLE